MEKIAPKSQFYRTQFQNNATKYSSHYTQKREGKKHKKDARKNIRSQVDEIIRFS